MNGLPLFTFQLAVQLCLYFVFLSARWLHWWCRHRACKASWAEEEEERLRDQSKLNLVTVVVSSSLPGSLIFTCLCMLHLIKTIWENTYIESGTFYVRTREKAFFFRMVETYYLKCHASPLAVVCYSDGTLLQFWDLSYIV